MATRDDVVSRLNTISTSVDKIRVETTGLVSKVDELQAAVNNTDAEIPDEILALVTDIQGRVSAVDDLVADAPTQPDTGAPVPV